MQEHENVIGENLSDQEISTKDNGSNEIESKNEVNADLSDEIESKTDGAEKEITEENKLEDQVDEVEEENVESEATTAKYKIIGQLPVYDALGSAINPIGIGTIQEYPFEYGDSLVEKGLAERIIEE